MATKRQPTPRKPTAGPVSWLALIAATTLGTARADTVRAEIQIDPHEVSESGPYRLIVQSYPNVHLGASTLPSGSARPLGSAQRAITPADLARGVRVDLVEVADDIDDAKGEGGILVAWVEPGEPDLEYDARRARPSPGSVWGLTPTKRHEATVQIRLDRRVESHFG